jgi:BlaI family penicillinase repressor
MPNISEAEWEVMKIIWSNSPCSSNDVIDALEHSNAWKPKTIKTLISRLLSKNVIGFKQEGRSYIYYPLVSEKECIKAESDSFLKRVYNGALKTMLVNFMQESDLTKEDIEELKRILEERK